jgi:hypothetical protein
LEDKVKGNFLIGKSQRYDPFIYWWDIAPKRKEKIALAGGIRFVQKDSDRWAEVTAEELLPLLTPVRQTSRNRHATGGNWGIKVLASNLDELAIEEPKIDAKDWQRIKVKWHP